ncbi:alkene reductase [Aspergillus aculeatinus CBS 121060]|uniref:FMN-linked oxidoreductase n=1 Tax=Aspergillus aculeatinus CBS 121060 TaxID=1448322 RepID=A0ACD1GYH8_9EURO|nr:FMN-linked oxidoreductase [Aspergillus aculeatinus CBS 121060]RAH66314.1 FMN-linked oxidoreductase [Aspergillus aculeatinus CBS 121060]
MSKLFKPLQIGSKTLNQRIAMAPMTRLRADQSHLPLPSVKAYYGQRASVPGSLIVTEATVISPRHGGYPNVPGIYSDNQVAAWKEVTDSVHSKGSYIYLQLWALGRAANPAFLNQGGHPLLSASDSPMKSTFSDEIHQPRSMTESEIHDSIADFRNAAKNAISAGFDGVEIHGANGYLVDQFLQDVSNTRTDKWGGNVANRSRFAVEVTRAVAAEIGNQRTAIRLSPWSRYQGMRMEDPTPQFSDLVRKLAQFNLSYLHVCESDAKDKNDGDLNWLLEAYGNSSPVLVAGNYNGDTAKTAVDTTYAKHDVVVAFGRPYIANPDLPFRVKHGLPFAHFDPASMYGQGSQGYIDYPFSEKFSSRTGAGQA